MVVGSFDVKSSEHLTACQTLVEVQDIWDWMFVRLGICIEAAIVTINPPLIQVFLRYDVDWAGPWTF